MSFSTSNNQAERPAFLVAAVRSMRVWAACPINAHDDGRGADRSEARWPLSRACVAIMAVACGVAVAILYYNQPMLPKIAGSIRASPSSTTLLPMLTQIGYAVGLFFFVPLGDLVDRRRLVLSLFLGIILSLAGLAVATSLPWLDLASLAVGMSSVAAQVLVAFAAQLSPSDHRGRIVGILQAGILAGILVARTVSGTISAHLNWRTMFWLAAAANFSLLMVLNRALPRSPPTASLPYARALSSLKELSQLYPQLRVSSLIGALLFAAFSVFWSTLAFHLTEFGYDLQAAGLFGVLGVAGAAIAPLAGQLTVIAVPASPSDSGAR